MKERAGKKDAEFTRMVKELRAYQAQGVRLIMQEDECTPEEIARASVSAEGICYMRDYIWDERGRIKEVRFDPVKDPAQGCRK